MPRQLHACERTAQETNTNKQIRSSFLGVVTDPVVPFLFFKHIPYFPKGINQQ